jgi:hypothetical protein
MLPFFLFFLSEYTGFFPRREKKCEERGGGEMRHPFYKSIIKKKRYHSAVSVFGQFIGSTHLDATQKIGDDTQERRAACAYRSSRRFRGTDCGHLGTATGVWCARGIAIRAGALRAGLHQRNHPRCKRAAHTQCRHLSRSRIICGCCCGGGGGNNLRCAVQDDSRRGRARRPRHYQSRAKALGALANHNASRAATALPRPPGEEAAAPARSQRQ